MIFRVLSKFFKCSHKNAIPNSNEGYCPDCGEYVRKTYYLVRCSNCGIKRIAKKTFDEIVPVGKYCQNCGEFEYVVEKHEKLNIVDVNYAIEVKETQKEFGESEKIEIWIEEPMGQNDYKKDDTLKIPEVKYITG